MARVHRRTLPDGVFHITSRGNRQQEIFLGDGDRRLFLALFAGVARRERWTIYGYCLMDNHYHALIEASAGALSSGMQRLNGAYAQSFNTFHGYAGHLFQGRFYSGVVEADGHMLELTRYLALNPVRAGLTTSPVSWPWSSYPALVGRCATPAFLDAGRVLRLFSSRRESARAILERFVTDGLAQEAEMDMSGVRPRTWRI
jgi:putative transposase